MNAKIDIRIGIATTVIAIAMLAMVSGAAAFAFETAGQIEYEDGTPCPAGWTVCEENLNQSYPEQPWCEPTLGDGGYIIWDYLVVGRAESQQEYARVNVSSQDGKWYGERTFKLEDVYDADWDHWIVDIVVHEVELPKILIEDAEDGDIHDDWVWYPGWEPIDQYSNWFEISTYNVNSTYSLCLDDVWRTWFPACVDKDIEDVSADQFGLLEFDVYGYNGSAGSSDAMLVGLVATDGVTTWFGHANPGTINSSLNQDYNAVDLVRTPTQTWKHFILDFANAEKTPMAGKTIDKVRLYLYTGGGQGHWTCFYIDNMYLVDPPILPDVIPPGADITSPDDGENVEGVVPIDIAAQDNAAISWYSIEIDDSVVLEKKPTEAEPSITDSYDWDTSAYADGEHTLAVIVSDTSENIGTDEITVYNGGDLTPDLNVTAITANPDLPKLGGLAFGPIPHPGARTQCNNLSAEIEEDNGVATGAFHVCFYVDDDLKCKVPVTGMAGSEKKTVYCNCSWYPLAGDYTINVTVDCQDEIDETDETNNTLLKDITVVPHGLKGDSWQGPDKNITTLQCHEQGTINLTYSVGDSTRVSGYGNEWTQYTVNWTASDLPIPECASIEKARLYVYYDWDKSDAKNVTDYFTLTFNGNVMPIDALYTDTKHPSDLGCPDTANKMCSYNHPYGMVAYDVTCNFDTTGNNALLDNAEPTTPHHVSMKGMLLLVVYNDPEEPERIIWINEGFDILMAGVYWGTDYGVSSEEAMTYAPFECCEAIPLSKVKNATLVTITNDAKDVPGSDKNRLYFNDVLIGDGAWTTRCPGSPGTVEIGCNVSNVTALLQATDNTAAYQSHIPAPGGAGDWMEATNAFLVVEYKKELIVSYGDSVHFKRNVRVPWRALDEPDRQGAVMFRNAKIAIELEDTISDCEKVSVWVRRLGFRVPTFEVGVSSDGSTWTSIGTETCSSIAWTRYDFTGDWDNVKYIGIRKPGSPWRPKLMGLDAVSAEGWN